MEVWLQRAKDIKLMLLLADALNPAELIIDWQPETFLTKHPNALKLKHTMLLKNYWVNGLFTALAEER
jgi:hypothetical protein